VLAQHMDSLHQRRAEGQVGYLEHLHAMEKLQNPTMVERAKAQIHGGVAGAREHHQTRATHYLKQMVTAEQDLVRLHPTAVQAGVPSAVALDGMQQQIQALQAQSNALLQRGAALEPGADQIPSYTADRIVEQHVGDMGTPTVDELSRLPLKAEAKAAAGKLLDRDCAPAELKQVQRNLLGNLTHAAANQQIQQLQAQWEKMLKEQPSPGRLQGFQTKLDTLAAEMNAVEQKMTQLEQPTVVVRNAFDAKLDEKRAHEMSDLKKEFEADVGEKSKHKSKSKGSDDVSTGSSYKPKRDQPKIGDTSSSSTSYKP